MSTAQSLLFIALFLFCHYSNAEYGYKNKDAHCHGKAKNTQIEHFFNVIFTEFQHTPPVCVCVQMCVNEATYCYPSGCFNPIDTKKLEAPQSVNTMKNENENRYMFVVDENPGHRDYIISTYDGQDESGPVKLNKNSNLYRPDAFDEKYKYNFAKYKKNMPQLEMKYNLRDQLKNIKSDLLGLGFGVSETRWPKNRNRLNSQKIRPYNDRKTPFINKSKAYAPVIIEHNENQRYFKRELQKSKEHDANERELYLINNFDNNMTDFSSFSLDTLLDNLIKTSVDKPDELFADNNETIDESLRVIPLNKSEINDTKILSIQNSQENIDKNKYFEDNEDTSKLNTMIKFLSKKIDKQNNTTMEMTKRMVTDVDFDIDAVEISKNKVDFFREVNNELFWNNATNKDEDLVETTAVNEKDSEVYDRTVANIGDVNDNNEETTPTTIEEEYNFKTRDTRQSKKVY